MSHQDKVFRISTIAKAFGVLDKLITLKSAESPVMLKHLLESFVSVLKFYKKERITHEFFMGNFLTLFESYPDIPVNLIVDPLVQVFNQKLQGQRVNGGMGHKPGTL